MADFDKFTFNCLFNFVFFSIDRSVSQLIMNRIIFWNLVQIFVLLVKILLFSILKENQFYIWRQFICDIITSWMNKIIPWLFLIAIDWAFIWINKKFLTVWNIGLRICWRTLFNTFKFMAVVYVCWTIKQKIVEINWLQPPKKAN